MRENIRLKNRKWANRSIRIIQLGGRMNTKDKGIEKEWPKWRYLE